MKLQKMAYVKRKRLSGISPKKLTILALRKETIWPKFLWYLATPPGKDYVHYVASRPNTLKALRL